MKKKSRNKVIVSALLFRISSYNRGVIGSKILRKKIQEKIHDCDAIIWIDKLLKEGRIQKHETRKGFYRIIKKL